MTAPKGSSSSGDAPPRAMMSVNDVAREVGCSTRHVRRLADSGKMPAPTRLGSLIRWPRQAIEAWIAEGCPCCRRGAK